MSQGKRLKGWRDFQGLSLEAAAKMVDVAHVTWRAWEFDEDVPRQSYREALEILTGIPAVGWRTEKETKALEKARAARAALDSAAASNTPDPEAA